MRRFIASFRAVLATLVALSGLLQGGKAVAGEVLSAVVEAEEAVTTCASPNNGAGPLWCYGAPLLVRQGDEVFASIMETGEGVPPLCNTRWRLFRRSGDGWKLLHHAQAFREREPCPLVAFADGRLFLSTNPSTQPRGTKYGACDPHLLRFSASDPDREGEPLRPTWADGATFTDHSYRGIAADAARGELLALNIDARTGNYFWGFRNDSGQWSRQGRIAFSIRACYPQVALKDRAAHVLAIGDIVEPNEQWRQYKYEKTKRNWDYVFRRLFYTWTPDIARADFAGPLELDTVEATAGHISNLDLWIDRRGSAHLLYLKRSVASALLRDRFFPDEPIVTSLEYAVVSKGQVVSRRTLLNGGEGAGSEIPGFARFHATDDGRLFVVFLCHGTTAEGKPLSENRILQILPHREGLRPVTIDL
ncbi:hypothetical protein AMJ85_07125, partial [candidate division BRC1 bacterium SM23_51]